MASRRGCLRTEARSASILNAQFERAARNGGRHITDRDPPLYSQLRRTVAIYAIRPFVIAWLLLLSGEKSASRFIDALADFFPPSIVVSIYTNTSSSLEITKSYTAALHLYIHTTVLVLYIHMYFIDTELQIYIASL